MERDNALRFASNKNYAEQQVAQLKVVFQRAAAKLSQTWQRLAQERATWGVKHETARQAQLDLRAANIACVEAQNAAWKRRSHFVEARMAVMRMMRSAPAVY